MLEFQRAGFDLHEVVWGTSSCQPLVSRFDWSSHVVGPRDERCWLLIGTLRWIGGGAVITGRVLEHAIGYYIHEGLYHRSSLSVFRACYAFARESYDTPCVAWSSVRQECLIADISRPFSPHVVRFLWGVGDLQIFAG